MNYNHTSETDKILHILDLMGAVSPETGVTTESLVEKGIEEGATKDIFTESWHGHKEGDHPWWLLLAAMSGTGSEVEVEKYNVPHLHRKKVSMTKNGRKTNAFIYWYDESYTHQVNYTGKAYREKMEKKAEIRRILQEKKDAPKSEAEARERMANNPEFVNINGKFVKKSWLVDHMDKAQALYGVWFMTHPDVYAEIYGEK
jgi:hypothetical protein